MLKNALVLLFVGLHPTATLAQQKILFVTSNQHFYGNTHINTANHFEEIVIPYDIFTQAGFKVDFVSPQGGAIPIAYLNTSDSVQKKYLYDGFFMDQLEHTLKPSETSPEEYWAIFYSGGGAAMFGVAEDSSIQKIAQKIHLKNGVIASICHGTAGLAYLKDEQGKSLYKDRKITGYPDKFENKEMPYYKTFPFSIDKAIEANEGQFVYSDKAGNAFYIVDGQFVTGQDPSAAAAVAHEVINQLKSRFKADFSSIEKSDYEQITEILNDYIEGTANGQPERLRKAFHPNFNLYTVAKDSLWVRSGEQYISKIKPGEKSNRIGRIISIDIEKDAAIAKAEITVPNWRIFTDYFLILKYEGAWKIVHKSYSYQEIVKKLNPPIEKDNAQKIDEILTTYHQYDLFNGNVLVAKNGKEILKKSYGKANFNWNIDHNPATKFRIGSLTKQFTALLILQLKQEGKLQLEDNINTYLPWYFKKTGSQITIHHLLSMTSGLPNYTDEASPEMVQEELAPKAFALKYFKDTVLFEPGKSIQYCNTGYYILGMIIEAITNKPYKTVLQEKIFDVLGMKNSGIDEPQAIIPQLAEGYTLYMGDYIIPHSINLKSFTYAAGAIYSTVEDLFLWDQSFYSEQLLNTENKKLMCTKYLASYGYGLVINHKKNDFKPEKEHTIISHDGGIGGFSSYMARIPEDSIFVVLLDNTRAGLRGDDLVGIFNNFLPVLYHGKAEAPKPNAAISFMRKCKLNSVDAEISHFKTEVLIKKHAYNMNDLEISLDQFANHYLSNGDLITAIKILKLNTEAFPQSSTALNQLGDLYVANQQFDFARLQFQKSLEQDPQNDHAKKMLEQISATKK